MLRPFLDTTWHQRFSGVALATRAEASTARYPLDPDGCLVRVHSQPANEKTDAVLVLNIEAARMIGREQPDQMLRGIRFTLDFDRLMGVRSWGDRAAASGRGRVITRSTADSSARTVSVRPRATFQP